jgi:hypothetical protein
LCLIAPSLPLLQDGFIHLTESIALPLQTPAECLTDAQITLDTAPGIAVLVEEGRKVVQVWAQRTAPQPGDYVHPNKEVFEHAVLLFLRG